MSKATRSIQAFVDKCGTLNDGTGHDIDVTFSLYRYREVVLGIPRKKAARGFCRISDGSSALEELFDAGTALHLSSEELDATIRLTSSSSFIVTGLVVEKSARLRGNLLFP
jgi:hypothetical protein